jgi:hypothetical protein
MVDVQTSKVGEELEPFHIGLYVNRHCENVNTPR